MCQIQNFIFLFEFKYNKDKIRKQQIYIYENH